MSVEIRGLDETIERLEGVADRVEDLTPATTQAAERLDAYVAQRFATRTAPDGTAWAPLKRASEATGGLEGSVFAEGNATGMRFGARAPHAGYQNAQRRFLPRTAAEVEAASQLGEAVKGHIVGEE